MRLPTRPTRAHVPLDELRAREYPLLDAQRHVYLDYTAANLPPRSLVARHADLLQGQLLGNPHSTNPASSLTTELVERARRAVLAFFNASPGEWVVIFTANATQALKLVGESYPFAPGGEFLLTFDNHNSVNGIREFARARHATTTYVPIVLPGDARGRRRVGARISNGRGRARANLFAYPAQSNFSGVQHPLEWIEIAHAHGWDVLLDAASFVPTNRLDLSRWQPDFVVQSFYKMFGYPTGVGLPAGAESRAREAAAAMVCRRHHHVASVQGDKHYPAEGEAAFEDGTPNYLALPAVEMGLEYINSIGLDIIHERVSCLTGWLIDRLVVAAASERRAAGAHLRSAFDRPPWRDRDVQLLRRRWPRSIIASSNSARTRPISRFAPDASAIPAAARSRWASPAPSSPPVFVNRNTRRT